MPATSKAKKAPKLEQNKLVSEVKKKTEATTKNKNAQKNIVKSESKDKELYIVFSEEVYYETTTRKIHGYYNSKSEANEKVKQIFYKKNPWGLSKEELDDRDDELVNQKMNNGLLKLKISPADSGDWRAWTEAVKPGKSTSETSSEEERSDSEEGSDSNEDNVFF